MPRGSTNDDATANERVSRGLDHAALAHVRKIRDPDIICACSGCANARKRGTCSNRRTIRRDVLEATVLEGLREHLMHPDLVAEFVAECQREWNRLRAESLGARAGLEADLKTVARQIRNIVEAVKAGFYAPAMRDEMTAPEARQAELEARLGEAPAEAPPALHPGRL